MEASLLKDQEIYFQRLKREFDKVYSVAKEARSKGYDPSLEPEFLLTYDVARRVEKAVGPP